MAMDQLSVALARFHFTNNIDYKIHPVVIVSNGRFNKAHSFVLACPITTKASLQEFAMEIPESDFSGKLKAKSFIRADAITSMEKNLFLKEIGKISSKLFEKLKAEIGKNF
jgi:mRNA-degrading endonuclease toxin of MazEF toxin-antitoxin module